MAALRKVVLLFVTCLFFLCSVAQTVRKSLALPYTRVGAYSGRHTDVFSYTANQASLSNLTAFAAGLYGERRFFLEELSFYGASVALPTLGGNFGLNGVYAGNANFNEARAGLAYGRKLGNKVAIGAQFNYHSFRLRGYGNASSVNAEAGLLFHLTEQIHVGVHVYNPTGSKWNKTEEESLPSVYTAGVGYDVSDKFFISAEAQKAENENVEVNAGLQYRLGNSIMARGGFSSATSTYFMGWGVTLKNVRLDVTASIHPQLGITPGLLLIFNSGTTLDKK